MTKTSVVVALLLVGVFFLWLFNHSGYFPYSHNPLQYMPDMHRTKALIPQRGYSFFEDKSSLRTPPAGTMARALSVYESNKNVLAASISQFSNPLPITREHVVRGQNLYMTYCVVCHGEAGLGNGYVVPPFPQPPTLQSEKVRGYADSQIFHIITVGQNSMGAYGPFIREDDRWKIVHYLRTLQLAENPTDADMKAFELQWQPSETQVEQK